MTNAKAVKSALTVLTRLAVRRPEKVEFLERRRFGSLTESIAAAEEAVELFHRQLPESSEIGPMAASAFHTLGLGHLGSGNPLEAAASFASAVEILAPFASDDPETFAAWWLELRENLRRAAAEAGPESEQA